MATQSPKSSANEPNSPANVDAQLIAACKAADAERASAALSQGANPSHLDPDGNPPLYWAIRCDSFECASLLVQAGAKKNWSRQPPGGHLDSPLIDFASACFGFSCGPRAHEIARLLLKSGYAKFNSGSALGAINSAHLTYPALRFLLEEAGVDPRSADLPTWAERENTAIFSDLLERFGKNAKNPNRLALGAIKYGRGANLRLIANAFRTFFETAQWRVNDDHQARHSFVQFALDNARVHPSRQARIFDTLDAFAAVAPIHCRAQILQELNGSRRKASGKRPPLNSHEILALQAVLDRIELGYHHIADSESSTRKKTTKKAPRL